MNNKHYFDSHKLCKIYIVNLKKKKIFLYLVLSATKFEYCGINTRDHMKLTKKNVLMNNFVIQRNATIA